MRLIFLFDEERILSKEAVYLAVGIREDGTKEVLSYTIAPTESAFNWQELLLEIKQRGVEDVLLFHLRWVEKGGAAVDAISSSFPKARYQTCLVHVARTISHKVRVEDRGEICEDFKSVYRSENQEAGKKHWKTSVPSEEPLCKITKSLAGNAYLLTFYSFPKSIWRSIYFNKFN